MAIARHVKRQVFQRDGYRCAYCRLTVDNELPTEHPRRATVDHIIPRSKGGRELDRVSNLITACRRCNHEKRTMSPEAFRWYRHMLMRGHCHEELMAAICEVEGEPRLAA